MTNQATTQPIIEAQSPALPDSTILDRFYHERKAIFQDYGEKITRLREAQGRELAALWRRYLRDHPEAMEKAGWGPETR